MQIIKPIHIPIEADRVLPPILQCGELTGIYFRTEDNAHGRIAFDKLDSIKLSRGECLPYEFSEEDVTAAAENDIFPWIFTVQNSPWQSERYDYEKRYYGKHYEFGGTVEEMIWDYSHYVFHFHDEFIEAIARGFWFEKNDSSLWEKPLLPGHPFLPIPNDIEQCYEKHGIRYYIMTNPIPLTDLLSNTYYCAQRLLEIEIELNGSRSRSWTLMAINRLGKIVFVLSPSFGKPILTTDTLISIDEIKSLYEKHLLEVAQRRKKMKRR